MERLMQNESITEALFSSCLAVKLSADAAPVEHHNEACADHPAVAAYSQAVHRDSFDCHPSSNLTALAVGARSSSHRSLSGQSPIAASSFNSGHRSPHLTNRSPSWANGTALSSPDMQQSILRQEQQSVWLHEFICTFIFHVWFTSDALTKRKPKALLSRAICLVSVHLVIDSLRQKSDLDSTILILPILSQLCKLLLIPLQLSFSSISWAFSELTIDRIDYHYSLEECTMLEASLLPKGYVFADKFGDMLCHWLRQWASIFKKAVFLFLRPL